MFFWTIVLAVYATMSAVTFVAFYLDKRAAVREKRRTPETTLHLFELFFGWPGALAAMILLRHKNRKVTYIAVFALIVALHAAGWWFMLR